MPPKPSRATLLPQVVLDSGPDISDEKNSVQSTIEKLEIELQKQEALDTHLSNQIQSNNECLHSSIQEFQSSLQLIFQELMDLRQSRNDSHQQPPTANQSAGILDPNPDEGVCMDENKLKALNIDTESWLSGKAASMIQEVLHQSYDGAVECLDTNYYGSKRVTEALLPLLQLSDVGARIVNVSSLRSELKRIPNEMTRNELNDIENLKEEKLDKILQRFLDDYKENKLEANGWSLMLPAYSISKAVLNAYTRILAKRYPTMYINCVHPGYVKTDANWNTGVISTEEGSKGPVMLALIPDGGHSGCYFDQINLADF